MTPPPGIPIPSASPPPRTPLASRGGTAPGITFVSAQGETIVFWVAPNGTPGRISVTHKGRDITADMTTTRAASGGYTISVPASGLRQIGSASGNLTIRVNRPGGALTQQFWIQEDINGVFYVNPTGRPAVIAQPSPSTPPKSPAPVIQPTPQSPSPSPRPVVVVTPKPKPSPSATPAPRPVVVVTPQPKPTPTPSPTPSPSPSPSVTPKPSPTPRPAPTPPKKSAEQLAREQAAQREAAKEFGKFVSVVSEKVREILTPKPAPQPKSTPSPTPFPKPVVTSTSTPTPSPSPRPAPAVSPSISMIDYRLQLLTARKSEIDALIQADNQKLAIVQQQRKELQYNVDHPDTLVSRGERLHIFLGGGRGWLGQKMGMPTSERIQSLITARRLENQTQLKIADQLIVEISARIARYQRDCAAVQRRIDHLQGGLR